MGSSTRFLSLLLLAVAAGCASPDADLTEDRPGAVAATVATTPSAADEGEGVPGFAGNGADGQDGRDARGNEPDGNEPRTSSNAPDPNLFATTNNDVVIGANFAREDEFAFDSTPPGSTTRMALRVGSLSDRTVTSVGVISETGAIRIVDDQCTGVRFPGPSCAVTIAATPPDEGKHNGRLVFTHSTGETSVKLSVVGEGIGQEGSESAVETTEPETQQELATDAPTTPPG
jgi:hypothetical protein